MRVPGSTRWLAAILVPLLVGCGRGDGTNAPGGNETNDAEAPFEMTYLVRGIVVALPSGQDDLVIKHESVPEFMNIKGEVVGMNSMQMPFPLSDEASLDGIAVGDKVQFVLEVDWNPGYYIDEIFKLGADTELDFRKDRPLISVDPDG